MCNNYKSVKYFQKKKKRNESSLIFERVKFIWFYDASVLKITKKYFCGWMCLADVNISDSTVHSFNKPARTENKRISLEALGAPLEWFYTCSDFLLHRPPSLYIVPPLLVCSFHLFVDSLASCFLRKHGREWSEKILVHGLRISKQRLFKSLARKIQR